MKLYLSSYRLGSQPGIFRDLVGSGLVGVICNANDLWDEPGQRQRFEWEREALAALGLDAVMLDLKDYFEQPEGLPDALAGLRAVWVRGGNTFVLRRAMVRSGFDHASRPLVEAEELVYGGFSAGAIAAGPSLRGTEPMDDPDSIPPGYAEAVVWEGLGFYNRLIIPHHRSDHPETELAERAIEYARALGIPHQPLRDGEVIVVDGDRRFIAGEPAASSDPPR